MKGRGRWLVVAAVLWGMSSAVSPVASEVRRIVSLAPSVTEMLFALDAGDLVVGVTDFCRYPAAARELPKVGGYLDTNLEVLVALRPDLVVLFEQHERVRRHLERLGIEALPLRLETVEDLFRALGRLGEVTGHRAAAGRVIARLRGRIAAVRRASAAATSRPRVLLVLGQFDGGGRLPMVVGGGTFLSELVEIAGGENVYADLPERYAYVSREELMRRVPDRIVELVAGGDEGGAPPRARPEAWTAIYPGAAQGRPAVAALGGDYVLVLGPRIDQTLADLRRIIAAAPPVAGPAP